MIDNPKLRDILTKLWIEISQSESLAHGCEGFPISADCLLKSLSKFFTFSKLTYSSKQLSSEAAVYEKQQHEQ